MNPEIIEPAPDEYLKDLSRLDLEKIIKTDPTSQVDSRSYFEVYAPKVYWEAKKRGQSLGAVFFDLDNLKEMNTTLGHPSADVIIYDIAQVIKELIRTVQRHQDMLARYAGDEFVALLPSTDSSGASVVAYRMVTGVRGYALDESNESKFTNEKGKLLLPTISAGAAAIDPNQHGLNELIAMAESAAMRAKKSKDTNVTFKPGRHK